MGNTCRRFLFVWVHRKGRTSLAGPCQAYVPWLKSMLVKFQKANLWNITTPLQWGLRIGKCVLVLWGFRKNVAHRYVGPCHSDVPVPWLKKYADWIPEGKFVEYIYFFPMRTTYGEGVMFCGISVINTWKYPRGTWCTAVGLYKNIVRLLCVLTAVKNMPVLRRPVIQKVFWFEIPEAKAVEDNFFFFLQWRLREGFFMVWGQEGD